jgi:hypothetical protein
MTLRWMVSGSTRIGSRPATPLADTLASIMDSAPYDGQLHALQNEGDQLQMILDRPAEGRQPGPLRSPLNTKESTETMCKDDWLMRLGDHGRTVIMAVPPTAHAMSGIHSSTTLSM